MSAWASADCPNCRATCSVYMDETTLYNDTARTPHVCPPTPPGTEGTPPAIKVVARCTCGHTRSEHAAHVCLVQTCPCKQWNRAPERSAAAPETPTAEEGADVTTAIFILATARRAREALIVGDEERLITPDEVAHVTQVVRSLSERLATAERPENLATIGRSCCASCNVQAVLEARRELEAARARYAQLLASIGASLEAVEKLDKIVSASPIGPVFSWRVEEVLEALALLRNPREP